MIQVSNLYVKELAATIFYRYTTGMSEPRKKGGRPPTGNLYPHRITAYFDDVGLARLKRLAEKRNGRGPRGVAATIRDAVETLDRTETEAPAG